MRLFCVRSLRTGRHAGLTGPAPPRILNGIRHNATSRKPQSLPGDCGFFRCGGRETQAALDDQSDPHHAGTAGTAAAVGWPEAGSERHGWRRCGRGGHRCRAEERHRPFACHGCCCSSCHSAVPKGAAGTAGTRHHGGQCRPGAAPAAGSDPDAWSGQRARRAPGVESGVCSARGSRWHRRGRPGRDGSAGVQRIERVRVKGARFS